MFLERNSKKIIFDNIGDNLKKSKIIRYVLGDVEYNELYNFFKDEVLSIDADLYVFTTRRCHLLFYLFLNEVFEKKEYKNKNFITDKAIFIYNSMNNGSSFEKSNQLKGKKCVVVDDILIHGRALKSVIDSIEKFNPSSITVRVFNESFYSTFSIEAEMHGISFDSYKKTKDKDWKLLSNKIVATLLLTSTPYTSYVYSYTCDVYEDVFSNLIEKLQKCSDEYKKIDLSLDECNNDNEISKVIRNNIKAYVFKFNDNNSHFSCIRVYYNLLTSECIITPYSFLYGYSDVEIDRICNCLFSNSFINDVDSYDTKYRAIEAYYNLFLLKNINDEIDLFHDNCQWQLNYDQINYSFYNGFGEELEKIIQNTNKNVVDIYKSHINDSNLNDIRKYYYKNNDDVYVGQYIKYLESNVNEFPFIDFICSINEEEDKTFNNAVLQGKVKKQKGLPSIWLNLINDSKLYYIIIQAFDTGLISVSPNYINKNVVCDYYVTGEQVCRLYQNKYVIFLKNMYDLYMQSNQNNYSFDDYIKNIIKDKSLLKSLFDVIDKYKDLSVLDNIVYQELTDIYLNSIYWKEQLN